MDIKKRTSQQWLIPSTNRQEVLTENKEAFNRFMEAFDSIGGRVDEINIFMIKKSIEKHELTIDDIEAALFSLYESGDYVNWGHVLKYINEKEQERPKQLIV